jgi:carbamoyltransferase
MLVEEASELLHTEAQNVGDNPFMTTAFRVRKEHLKKLEGVTSIDGTCRPHFVFDENPLFRELLLRVQKESGRGVVLNTSFNLHGEPMVCTPDDALDTLKGSGFRYLFLEDFLVENRSQ